MSKQRDRGRLLTTEALTKLQQAIRVWEVQHERKCTQERIKELTGEFKEGGLDPGTISKIRKGKEGVDSESIHCLFRTFGLQLEEADLVAAIAFITQGDPNFVGREGAIADLKTLMDRGTKVIVIQARGGVGKTTLARKYLQQEFGTFLEFPIAKETKDIASVESLIEEKLRQLGEEPGREFLVSIDRLKRKLQFERIGILIDNLEPALDSAGKLIEAHRRYLELLRVLADPTVRSLTLITTRERLREPSITVQHYLLRSLNVAAWEAYFQSRSIATVGSTLSALHNAYGGNAKAMDILSGAIVEDFSGDIAEYWQVNQDDLLIERDLEDLVTAQFNRIQELDRNAYNLLCRMGCYRYQDVPRVPIEGLLCLLWDVAEGQRRRVVKALQDRSLVDCQDGEYWLHPVIRGEAIGRLRSREDWKLASQNAAGLWTESVETIESYKDAKRALEAYYHYIEINDFAGAANILIKGRKIKWSQHKKSESLGRSLYKLGILKETISAIVTVIDKLEVGYPLCRLYNVLGDAYWLTGNIHEAISCHQSSRKIAIECLISEKLSSGHNFGYLKVISYFNIGNCQINLWEIEDAVESFRKTIELIRSSNSGDDRADLKLMARASYCLAFLLAYVDSKEEALLIIEDTCHEIETSNWGVWSQGYGFFFLGSAYQYLGKIEASNEMYYRAVSVVENSFYFTIKGKALNGLGELNRECGNFSDALLRHSEAISILEEIGVKCDLAEAYYQRGLTHQAMNGKKESYRDFQEAIRLFTEMEAPKQVERVRRSLEN